MQQKIKYLLFTVSIILFVGCTPSYNVQQLQVINKTDEICKNNTKSDKPWHISNLYDCKTKSFFIPYELWSGAKYNGDKENSKFHQVDRKSTTISYGKSGNASEDELWISGTSKWTSPYNNKQYDIYTRERADKTQYFVANDMGIGRVYDSREDRYYSGTNIKFPAGYGWKLNEPRSSSYSVSKNGSSKYRNTTIKITDISLTNSNELYSITFEWYPRDGELDHIYVYQADVGLVETRRP